MALGKPVITTDVAGCRDTVINGKNGFLVPAKNVQKLARAMEECLNKPHLIKKMGNRSRQMAVERYDESKINNEIINVLEGHY